MGGGDLNTKKSWHPNTIKNQERVWKAEQVLANENKRIADLRKEIDQERFREELSNQGQNSGVLPETSNKKMDWMYKEPEKNLNREQYLLGKAIDKTFEKIAAEEQTQQSNLISVPKNHVEHECIPFSIRNLRNKTGGSETQVDIARKLLEDPLVAIRKREAESRSQLLQNPVKLKEISLLLKAEQQRDKKKKEKKKSKKNKRDKKDLEHKIYEKLKNLGGGDKDINDLLASSALLNEAKKKKRKKSSKYSSESESEDSSDDDKNHRERSRKGKKSKKKRNSSPMPSPHKKLEKDKHHRDEYSDERKTMIYKSKDFQEKNYGLVRADGSKIEISKKYEDKQPRNHKEETKKWQKPERKQLSEHEMEEKRRQMMQDASKRDKQREKNVAYYKARDKKLELKEKQEEFKEDFVEKHLRVAASQGSVESRIKSNIYNIQRSQRDMDTNFARR